jgi:hypothetical protein
MSSHIIPAIEPTSMEPAYSVDAIITFIINNHTGITIEQLLENYLDGIPTSKRLQQVQDLLLAISEADSLVAEIASKVWSYVMTHKLWESEYSSLEAFKDSIAYDITIHELLKKHSILSKRQQADCRSILANWGSLPFDALPVDLHPVKFSRDLLQFLNRLSKICPLDKAVILLKEQVHRRYWEAGYSSYSNLRQHIIVADVMHVYRNLQLQITSGDNLLKESQRSEVRNRYV